MSHVAFESTPRASVRERVQPATASSGNGESVVLVTYAWPPDSEVGALRPAKLAKYLLREGWTPVVVTVREDYAERVSPDDTSDPRGTVVLRTRRIPSPRDIYMGLKRTTARLRGSEAELEQSILACGHETTSTSPETLLGRLKRYLLSFVLTPDGYLGWSPFAVHAAVRAVRDHKAKAVITTGPPFTAHLIGLAVKNLTGVRWIADFRDPWSENKRPPETRADWSDRVIRWLRARVVMAADTVVCVTPAMTDSFRKLYPDLPGEKWATITNGFDREDFTDLATPPKTSPFRIVYVGGLDYGRTPEPLLRVLGEMLRDGDFPRDNVSVRFVGDCRYAGGRSLDEIIAYNGLADVVEIVDFLPRRRALEEMVKANVLLLLVTNQQNEVPAKTYEYMAVGGKILALTEDSIATADLIRSTDVGKAISPRDSDGIKRVLRQWYEEYQTRRAHGSKGHRDNLEGYEWSALGARYAALLKSGSSHVQERDERPTPSLVLEKGKSV